MKTALKLLVPLGIAAVAVGCGADQTRDIGTRPADRVFEIRLLGQNEGELSAVLLPVASVTASTRGHQLDVQTVVDFMDLTATRQAWLLGRVSVPEGAPDVDISVRFDDAGGYEWSRGNGAVEARGAEVRWRAPVEWLRRNGHAVIQMDLKRSLVARGSDSARLIPSVTVSY